MLKMLKSLNYHEKQIDTLVNAKAPSIISHIVGPFFAIYLLIDFININILIFIAIFQLATLYTRLVLAKKIIAVIDINLKRN